MLSTVGVVLTVGMPTKEGAVPAVTMRTKVGVAVTMGVVLEASVGSAVVDMRRTVGVAVQVAMSTEVGVVPEVGVAATPVSSAEVEPACWPE